MSVHEDICDAVCAEIQGLDLGIRDASIEVRKLDRMKGLKKPCVVVSPLNDAAQAVSNTSDDVAYGVLVTIVRVSNGELVEGLDANLNWRETIRKHFRPKGTPILAAVPAVYNAMYDGGAVINPTAFDAQTDAQSIGMRFFTREPRA